MTAVELLTAVVDLREAVAELSRRVEALESQCSAS